MAYTDHDLTNDLENKSVDKPQEIFAESSNEFIDKAIQKISKIPDYDPSKFDVYGRAPKGNFVYVKRTGPSHCFVCDRIHESDDTMLLIFNEEKQRHRHDDDDEEEDDEVGHSGTDDPLAGDQTEDSQGEDNGKRSRRVSTRGNYGISWIEKKVNLPNRKGFGIVKKADRDTCTVEIQSTKIMQVFKKKNLQLAGDSHAKTARQNSRNRNNAKAREKLGLADDVVLMGTTPSRYIAFQDLVKRFAMRRREKVKKRPNLIEWQARLNLNYLENGFWDKSNPSVIDLVVVPQCEICGVEKEV
ncbi:unnamed protein product [Phytophthora lilii]|uniref:Unnamed protein product n=1 Tax=Phytophthora lilii TaxID=2077276 RepID=A0A9W6YJX1_9STRA|nr:unnamed protein product [Phytophthora lilii]